MRNASDAVEHRRTCGLDLRGTTFIPGRTHSTAPTTGALTPSRRPPSPQLLRAREADDFLALQALARDEAVARLARAPAAVRLLWEVCQIPDFRKTLTDHHTALLRRIYRFLMENDGRVAAGLVVALHVAERFDGGVAVGVDGGVDVAFGLDEDIGGGTFNRADAEHIEITEGEDVDVVVGAAKTGRCHTY